METNNDLIQKEILERMDEYRNKINYNCLGTEVLLLSLMSIEDSMTNLILTELNVKEEDKEELIYNLRKDILNLPYSDLDNSTMIAYIKINYSQKEEIYIEWKNIVKLGDDIILVNITK